MRLNYQDPDWQKYWLKEAYKVALDSPDLSTQNGAILLNKDGYTIGRGCNTFPDSLKITEERLQRPLKYSYTTHAERKALFNAIHWKMDIRGSVLVSGWAACDNCANAMIEMGVRTLITHQDAADRSPDRWKESIQVAYDILTEAGVNILFYKGEVGAQTIRHNGTEWNP